LNEIEFMRTSQQSANHSTSILRHLLAVLIAGCGLAVAAGCAAEDKKPRTVTEFLKQPRVGELQE
jgi:hypothetical protein